MPDIGSATSGTPPGGRAARTLRRMVRACRVVVVVQHPDQRNDVGPVWQGIAGEVAARTAARVGEAGAREARAGAVGDRRAESKSRGESRGPCTAAALEERAFAAADVEQAAVPATAG